ncbi:MAG: hypothetical protein K5829_07040 [Treponema sp.]|nr:hypothetical protein [Treponema sp.]
MAIYFDSDDEIILTGYYTTSISKLNSIFAEEIKQLFNSNESLKKDEIIKYDNCNIYKLSLDIKECGEIFLSKQSLDDENKSLFKVSIKNEIKNQIRTFFAKPNYCLLMGEILKIIVFSKNDLDQKLLQKHIINSLKPIADFSSEDIKIQYFEKTSNQKDIYSFLQVE